MAGTRYLGSTMITLVTCLLLFLVPSLPAESEEIAVLLESQPVREYVNCCQGWKRAGVMTFFEKRETPDEFRRVVAMGKAAMPSLLSYLGVEDNRRDLRLASWIAVTEITHRSFGSLFDFWSTGNRQLKRRLEAVEQANNWWRLNASLSQLEWFEKDLASGDRWLRIKAARALGLSGQVALIPALRQSLKDEDFKVREESAIALCDLGDRCSVAAISEILLETEDAAELGRHLDYLMELTGRKLELPASIDSQERIRLVKDWLGQITLGDCMQVSTGVP